MTNGTTPAWATALVAAIARRPRLAIGAVLAVTLVAGLFAGRWFRADNSARVWLLDDDPALVAYDDFLAQFGNDEVVLIAVGVKDSVYTPETLEVIRRASDRIDAHPDIRWVGSVTASTHIDGDAIEIRVEPLVADGPIDEAVAAATRRKVQSDPNLRATLVSDDERVTLIAAQFASLDKVMGRRPQILDDLREIVRQELRGGDREVHVGGIGVIYDAINRAVLHDTRVFISLSYLLILVGLWVLFRRLAWVLLALGIIVVATVATAGLFGALDRKLNMVTSIVPTLILTVGVLDLVHLISAREEGGGDVQGALAAVAVPCVFNTITDMIGFLALVSAPMAGVRDFGLLAALGLGFLLTASLVFAVPTLLRDARRRPGAGAARRAGLSLAFVRRAGTLAASHRWWVIGVGAAAIGLSVVGASRIVVDTYNLEFLAADHPTRTSHEFIEERFGLYIPLEMTVTGGAEGALKEPETLRRLERAERAIEALPAVDRVTGLPEVITRLNEVVMDGDPAERRIPDTRPAIAQELLLYEGDPDAAIDRLADPSFSVGRVTGRVRMTTARGIKAIITDVEAAANAELGAHEVLRVAGYLSLYVEIIDNIASAQV
ncbi:MAG TPA: MMPL family transporter, partial [Kofleriaceae bacterium]|nr:MMPL family transporter [Kofleriaceae bacterium]